MRIKWRTAARLELLSAARYIRKHHIAAADRFRTVVKEKTAALEGFPEAGRLGRVAGTREIVLAEFPYVIVYVVHKGWLEIVDIIHTARVK